VTSLTLAERIVAVHRALQRVPHAFGGALALAYYAEPRTTVDIDLNVFVGPERFEAVARRLARLGLPVDDPAVVEAAHREGQVRIMWDTTPLDRSTSPRCCAGSDASSATRIHATTAWRPS
jgi:hypothetical protein